MPRMLERFLVVSSVVLGVSLLTVSCKDSGGEASADGGTVKKFICKINQKCWICQDDDQMKKCIINPVTSGCKQSTSGDCS